MTVWLVGIRPGRPGQPPLSPTDRSSSSVDRLRTLLCLTPRQFEKKFHNRTNVGDSARGRYLIKNLEGTIYVLGREAWACLGLPKTTPFFSRVRMPGASFKLLPHPSGRNLMYNDPALRRKVRRLLCHTP